MIRNSARSFGRLNLDAPWDATAMCRQAGWEDVRLGLPYREDYETWPTVYQQIYEEARVQAANCRAYAGGGPLPRWDYGVGLSHEAVIMMVEATKSIGEARVMIDVEEAVKRGITYERDA